MDRKLGDDWPLIACYFVPLNLNGHNAGKFLLYCLCFGEFGHSYVHVITRKLLLRRVFTTHFEIYS